MPPEFMNQLISRLAQSAAADGVNGGADNPHSKPNMTLFLLQVNLDMMDDMLGPSPMHIKYSSYVYDRFCI